MKRYLPFLIISAVLILALGSGALFYRYRSQPPPRPAYGKAGAEPPHLRGSPRASVILEEFGDFQCFPCSVLWTTLKKVEPDYGKRLAVIFREHPLPMHPYALDAARAAEAAGLQGRFWEMYDLLYQNHAAWSKGPFVRPSFRQYAATLGLDLARFDSDMDGSEVTKRIAADQVRGDSLGVDRTPIIFLNGERLAANARSVDGLHAAIDAALKPKPRSPTPGKSP
ncbi:MAG TPA: thioredoxin domain-containing protein [Chthoniobacterales bacterium]|jgi:protein-disulfide isomerase